ncbi:MAG: TetR/AcrR family transcriptional regulator [Deltaproteobacteria bacterium]|nr:TetR/AcrR family transcriptional regulator [Deltaproteobacteria bacterium]
MDKAPAKRDIILDAAIRVFAEKGYSSSRTLDISKEAGVAYGSLYSYFSSKDEILLSIFRERWRILLERIDQINRTLSDPDERFLAIIDFIFRSYQRNPAMMKVLIMDVPRHKEFYTPENWKLYNAFFKALADIFREGQEKEIYNRNISPLIATYCIYGAVDTTIRQYVYNPEFNHEEFPIEQTRQQIVGMLKQGYSKREV